METKRIGRFILSAVAIIFCIGFLLTGCGGNDNKTTTISLSEAKTIIVNALAIDQPQVQTMTLAEQGNRDVFVKFGKTKISLIGESKMEWGSQKQITSIIADKTGGNWNKYILEDSLDTVIFGEITTLEYFDGEYVFTNYNGEISKTEFSSSIVGILPNDSAQLLIFDKMFSDDAFETIYKKDVKRTDGNDGFSLAVDINVYDFWVFMLKQAMGDNYQDIVDSVDETFLNKLKNEATAQLVINFNNNEDIQNLTLTMTSFGQADDTIIPTSQTITAERYTGEITQPQWVTDFLAQ